MNSASLIGLVQNAALLLAAAFIFDAAAIRWRMRQSLSRQATIGLALGAIGITVMLTPWTFVPGIVFDTRSVLLSISGLFFGSFSTAIVMAMTAAFRFYQGGTGAWTGGAVILISGTIGIAWGHFRCRTLTEISWRELYLFGMVVHIVMLALMLTLPWETALRVLSNITLPVLAIYPLGTALLGVLMVNRLRRERIDESLRDTETRYRLLFEHSPDGILIIDPATARPLEFNETAHRQLGYSREEFARLSIFDLEADETPEETRSRISQVKQEGRADFETRQRTRQGDIRNIHVTAQITEILGQPVYHCIWRDITARKRAVSALQESEELYRSLFKNMLNGFAYCRMLFDQGGKPQDFIYLNVNSAFESLTGLKNVVGRKVSEIIPGIQESDAGLFEIYGRVALTGKPERFERYVEALKMWFSISVYSPEKEYFVAIFDVITERKNAEHDLREKSKLNQTLLDAFPCVALLLRPQTREIIAANAAAVKVGALPGTRCFSTWGQRQAPCPWCLAPVVWATGEAQCLEVEALGIFWEAHWIPVAKDLYMHYALDITDRKKSEEELQKTLDRLRHVVGTTVQVMVSAVEARDPYTAGHQIRSSNLARAIATELGLRLDKINAIRMAGSIHDIGKLSIPAEILSKPIKLSEIEFSLIKEHARQGYEILKNVESDWPLAEMVYQHHERMDGSGYPRNLKGNEILMEARILAVADVVESMASHRPYRPALGIDAALKEIEKNRGALYDEAVADACLRLFRDKGFQIGMALPAVSCGVSENSMNEANFGEFTRRD